MPVPAGEALLWVPWIPRHFWVFTVKKIQPNLTPILSRIPGKILLPTWKDRNRRQLTIIFSAIWLWTLLLLKDLCSKPTLALIFSAINGIITSTRFVPAMAASKMASDKPTKQTPLPGCGRTHWIMPNLLANTTSPPWWVAVFRKANTMIHMFMVTTFLQTFRLQR